MNQVPDNQHDYDPAMPDAAAAAPAFEASEGNEELWIRRILGIITIGGGAIGVTNCINLYLSTSSTMQVLLVLAAVGLYAWGTWCGVALLQKLAGAERSSLKFWAIQIPSFGSPIAVYSFSSGSQIAFSLQLFPLKTKSLLWLGSTFKFSLMQASEPWSVGVNIVAAAAVWWLCGQVKKYAR